MTGSALEAWWCGPFWALGSACKRAQEQHAVRAVRVGRRPSAPGVCHHWRAPSVFSPAEACGRVPVLGPTGCLAPPPGKWHGPPHSLLQGPPHTVLEGGACPRSFPAGIPFLSLGCRDKSPDGPALPSPSCHQCLEPCWYAVSARSQFNDCRGGGAPSSACRGSSPWLR